MFCPNCGQQIADGARFCQYCGTQLAAASAAAAPVYTAAAATDHHVILLGRGTCALSTLRDLIEDLLGYTDAQSKELTNLAPVEIACNLTEEQALYIAQLLSEYGAEVSVCDNNGTVDFSSRATASVFRGDSLLDRVADVLGTLTLANRVNAAVRWTRFDPRRHLFAPRYARPPRAVYARRSYARPVPPPPRPGRPMPPPPRVAVRPAPRPAPGPRPMPGPGPMDRPGRRGPGRPGGGPGRPGRP